MLPLKWLLIRLANEEKKLKERFPEIVFKVKNLYNLSTGRGKYLEIPTPIGIDKVEVVKVYEISNLRASGYAKVGGEIKPQKVHSFNLYVLRGYPFGQFTLKTQRRGILYEAPVRIRHMSNIFHPNIMPGPKYVHDDYAGAVCWGVYSNWITTNTLDKLVEAYKLLIENPNPDPKEALGRPICKEAALYFMRKLGQKVVDSGSRPVHHSTGRRKPIVRGVS